MYEWLLLGAIVLVLALVYFKGKQVEGFATVDVSTAQAQRQALQMEGERRYNDLARLQAPTTTISADKMLAAVQQTVPVPTSQSESLLTMLGISTLGGADDRSNKQGQGVEQTGMVQAKIDFCESLTTIDCDKLDDPRMAECGFCHRDGTDSKGKAHRGGMYISADDQQRANELSTSFGQPAPYVPTVGKCKLQNFTLSKENCKARELQLKCQSAGAPSSSNECAQCYGKAPGSATGLVYVGPKPRTYTAQLWVSHPGMHNYQGTGIIVTMPDNSTIQVPYSDKHLLDPKMILLNNIKEGDTISIKIFGVPMVWCAWLSSMDGKRTVSIDIGLQNEAANPGMVIAGDKFSSAVSKATASYDGDVWTTFQNQVPNNVLWYMRRDEILHGGITSASYGDGNNNIVWVGKRLKSLAGDYVDVPISPLIMDVDDPSPGNAKFLTVWLDNGQTLNVADGTVISKNTLNNSANLLVQIPATLVDPMFPADRADCPSGPLVFTEVGAGLMGSHSCFKPDGSFNPTQFCLQELFQSAGGTQQGTAFPNSQSAVNALLKPNASAPTLDATMAYLNNLGSIAQYGVDSTGKSVDFATYVSAAKAMVGITPKNPCDGPAAKTGPLSAECLDYLWRTSGNASEDSVMLTDPSTLPYQYCGKAGLLAPLNPDGSVNQANVAVANSIKGGTPAVRAQYAAMFNATKDSSNFDNQVAAMRNCFGTNIVPPAEPPSACPPPNPTDWQCFPPEKVQPPEVFSVCPSGWYDTAAADAPSVCASYGAQVATHDQITAAQAAGADWCQCGWARENDGSIKTAYYPMSTILPSYGYDCGTVGVNSCSSPAKSCVTCFGVKPPKGTTDVAPFAMNGGPWNNPQTFAGFAPVSDTAVPALREVANQIQIAARGTSSVLFPSADACNAWVSNPASDPTINSANSAGAIQSSPFLTAVDQYIRTRV